jgi:hypothetical protein
VNFEYSLINPIPGAEFIFGFRSCYVDGKDQLVKVHINEDQGTVKVDRGQAGWKPNSSYDPISQTNLHYPIKDTRKITVYSDASSVEITSDDTVTFTELVFNKCSRGFYLKQEGGDKSNHRGETTIDVKDFSVREVPGTAPFNPKKKGQFLTE